MQVKRDSHFLHGAHITRCDEGYNVTARMDVRDSFICLCTQAAGSAIWGLTLFALFDIQQQSSTSTYNILVQHWSTMALLMYLPSM